MVARRVPGAHHMSLRDWHTYSIFPDAALTNSRPRLTGLLALGNKEYYCRGGKIRKVHGKRHHQAAGIKWLNYSGPLPTMQVCAYLKVLPSTHKAREAKTCMKPKTALRGIALFGGCWFVVALTGCSGPQVQQIESHERGLVSSQPSDIGAKQLDPLLVRVSQLQVATLEALDAARMVGTAESHLTEALQSLAAAEQLLQAGRTSYTAKRYEESLGQLQAANRAFRQAEEAAVRAGLEQLERELVADYGRLLPPQNRHRRPAGGAVRVNPWTIDLRDGAGLSFPVVGKAQRGDRLNLVAESGEWYRVQTTAGLLGWVSKSLVTRLPEP